MYDELMDSVNYLDWYFREDDGGADKDAMKAYDKLRQNVFRLLSEVDVEPKRKTGVWLEEEATDDGNWRYTCSACGYVDIQSRSAQVPYCWHCGSRMQKMSEVADNGSVQ